MPRTTSSSTFQELTDQLSTDEIVKRLKSFCKTLGECDSLDDTNASSVRSLSLSLVQPFLQFHRNREVKALVACCIADIFRVSYPDPPYDDSQKNTVFNLFVSQLQGLEKPSSTAFKYSFQLLETLASIRLFNLCIEMEDQDILTDVFKMLFSVINKEQSTKVKNYIIDILSALVQDGDSLPQEVMDIIFYNILEPNKSENKAAYAFTVDFIRKTSSHIEPYIHLFFNNSLVTGKSSESEVADHLYDLILELHAIDSSVLLAVMPQLEFKLKSTDTDERYEVTKLLAKMFSSKSSKLATENRPLWNCFLGRFADVSPHIRVECITHSKYFLIYHSHLAEDITLKLHDRFYDKEERVRLEVVKSVCEAAADNFDLIPKMLCDDLEGRMRDKVWTIRKESISNMARIYRQIMSSSFSSGGALDSSSLKNLNWIPIKILHSYYRDSAEDKLCVERCFLSCIVPINLPDDERMERMVHVYNSLSDDHALRAFDALLVSRHRVRSCLRELILAQEDTELEGDEKKQIVRMNVIHLSRYLPDSVKSQPYLDYLMRSIDEGTLKESLLKSIDTSCSCADVLKAKMDVVSQVGSKAGIGSKVGVLDTVRNLLDRSCPLLIDANCIKILVIKVCSELYEPALGVSKEAEEEAFQRAKNGIQLIKVLSEIIPANFKCSEIFERLITLLRHDDKEIVKSVLQILTSTGDYIDQSVAGCLQPILTKLAQKGEPGLAKDTVKCIQKAFKEPKPIMERLYSSLIKNLDYDDEETFSTSLISLSQIAKLQPQVFATKYKHVIKDFVVSKLMTVDRANKEYVEGDKEWASDDEISYEARMKVLGIKLLINWLLGSDFNTGQIINAVLRLLDTTLSHDGDLQADDNISSHDRSRLRLGAACGLLKLAKSSIYRDFITLPIFQRLAITAQDSCEEVREIFMEKLNKGLLSLQLPLGYLSIMVHSGIEPEKSRRDKFRKMISNNVMKRRQCLNIHFKAKENPHAILPEYAVSHAIYLVAHHPQFSRTNGVKLDMFKECLWFFLEPIVLRGENYGFLGKLLDTIKLTVDAQDPKNTEANKNLYAACDLAMGVMASKLTHIKLGNFSGDVVLPTKLFQSKGAKIQSNTTRYLPPEYNCTPTKRIKIENKIEGAPNSTATETVPAKKEKAQKPTRGRPAKETTKSPTKETTKSAPTRGRPAKETTKSPTKETTKSAPARGRPAKETTKSPTKETTKSAPARGRPAKETTKSPATETTKSAPTRGRPAKETTKSAPRGRPAKETTESPATETTKSAPRGRPAKETTKAAARGRSSKTTTRSTSRGQPAEDTTEEEAAQEVTTNKWNTRSSKRTAASREKKEEVGEDGDDSGVSDDVEDEDAPEKRPRLDEPDVSLESEENKSLDAMEEPSVDIQPEKDKSPVTEPASGIRRKTRHRR